MANVDALNAENPLRLLSYRKQRICLLAQWGYSTTQTSVINNLRNFRCLECQRNLEAVAHCTLLHVGLLRRTSAVQDCRLHRSLFYEPPCSGGTRDAGASGERNVRWVIAPPMQGGKSCCQLEMLENFGSCATSSPGTWLALIVTNVADREDAQSLPPDRAAKSGRQSMRTKKRQHSASRTFRNGFVSGVYAYEDGIRAFSIGLALVKRGQDEWYRGFRAGQQSRNYQQR